VAAAEVLLDRIVGETVHFPHGGVVFIKGDHSNAAYMVRSGRIEIREAGRIVEAMTQGEIFGEMALIDSEPRSASAVAVGPTELAVIDNATFHKLVRADPDFALAVMRLMSRRLRATLAGERGREERVSMPVVPLPRTA
jgi:CRP/FNR family transcriptional regulator, cyclic AMP receptor protein